MNRKPTKEPTMRELVEKHCNKKRPFAFRDFNERPRQGQRRTDTQQILLPEKLCR